MRSSQTSAAGLAAIAICLAMPANAQSSGFFIGPKISAVDHHFVLVEDLSGGELRRNATAWGLGGGAIFGYQVPVTGRIAASLEGSLDFGGRTPSIASSQGQTVLMRPRWGFSVAVRPSLAIQDDLAVFVKAGYGEHHYHLVAPQQVERMGPTKSFVIGAGFEKRLSKRIGLRIEFEHLDGTRNQFALSLPFHF